MSSSGKRDNLFLGGLGLLMLGLGLFAMMIYGPASWNLTGDGFAWMFRIAVLSDAVGIAFLWLSHARRWLQITLTAIASLGICAWVFASFVML